MVFSSMHMVSKQPMATVIQEAGIHLTKNIPQEESEEQKYTREYAIPIKLSSIVQCTRTNSIPIYIIIVSSVKFPGALTCNDTVLDSNPGLVFFAD